MNRPVRDEGLRIPPHSIEAEQSVLGAVMLVPASLAKVRDWLHEEDFYRSEHRLLYRVLCTMIAANKAVDPITLTATLEADGMLELVGGDAYLVEIASNTPSAANIEGYAEFIVERARLRRAIEAGTDLAGKAFAPGSSSEEIIAAAIRKLTAMQSSRLRGGLQSMGTLVPEWLRHMGELYKRGEAISGMPTPWAGLNNLTHGLQNGELIIVAGRPNMGKSIMGQELARHAALALNRRVAFFSLEMTAKALLDRMTAAITNVPFESIKSPKKLTDEEWARITPATTALIASQLCIDDTHGLTSEQICARARRAHMQAPIGLVVIDHMHRAKMLGRTPQDRQHELRVAAQEYKGLGKEFGCPVVALAQLNRNLLKRDDKRPEMDDLREAGGIEEEGDTIVFLHRDDYYDRNSKHKGVVEAIIGKGRDVKTGEKAKLKNRFDVMRMDDFAGDDLPLEEPDEGAKPAQRAGFRRHAAKPRDPVAEALDK